MATAHTARTAWRARLVKRARTRTRIGRLAYRALTLVLDSILQLARRVRCVGLGSSLQGTWHLAWTVGVVSTATVARASDVLRGLSRRTTRGLATFVSWRATVPSVLMVWSATIATLVRSRTVLARRASSARTRCTSLLRLPRRYAAGLTSRSLGLNACPAMSARNLTPRGARAWSAREANSALATLVSDARLVHSRPMIKATACRVCSKVRVRTAQMEALAWPARRAKNRLRIARVV